MPPRVGRTNGPTSAGCLDGKHAPQHATHAIATGADVWPDEYEDPHKADDEPGPLPGVHLLTPAHSGLDGDHPEGNGVDQHCGQSAGQPLRSDDHAAVAKPDHEQSKYGQPRPDGLSRGVRGHAGQAGRPGQMPAARYRSPPMSSGGMVSRADLDRQIRRAPDEADRHRGDPGASRHRSR